MLGRTSGGIALRQRVGRRCKPAVGCRALGPRSSSAARRGILQGFFSREWTHSEARR